MKFTLHARAANEYFPVILNEPDPEVLVLTSTLQRLSFRLKSTYLSRLGQPPILVSHWPTGPGTHNRPRPRQREAHDMVGVSFERRCLLDHLAELQEWLDLIGVEPSEVTVPDSDLERVPTIEL